MADEIVKRTQDELVAELRARFGPDESKWAFVCPICNDVASVQDFREALAAAGRDEHPMRHVGQVCIGRISGALAKPAGAYKGRGCDWAAFGLFAGPEFVIMSDGREVPSFAIAPAPGEAIA